MSPSSFRSVLRLAAAVAVVGCGSGSSSNAPVATGGNSNATGGAAGVGGASTTGGEKATGGAGATGGTPNNTGGSITGTGGANDTGGTDIGGTGGTRTGGTGSNTGGTNPDGTGGNSGGANTGGTVSNTGGTNTGGNTGGANAGGTGGNTGGTAGATTSDIATGGLLGSGGTVSGGASGSGGSTADPFVLDWEDNFDSFDSSLWQLMTHTWDGNLAQFSTENTEVASGILSINLTSEPSDAAKPYRGVEMRSTKTITYGKISARIRFAQGPGVVSGLVAIYTPWPAGDWNEIDIEHLGNSPTSVQLNCMYYAGTPVANPTTSVTPTQDPQMASLGFDAEAGFHQYDVEWTPASVRFVIDGTVTRTWTAHIDKMKLAQNILFTIWASSSADWAGAISSAAIPTSADIDWIKVYSSNG
jgi:endo-1,3-1,4-beta-glycanase ExoK